MWDSDWVIHLPSPDQPTNYQLIKTFHTTAAAAEKHIRFHIQLLQLASKWKSMGVITKIVVEDQQFDHMQSTAEVNTSEKSFAWLFGSFE